MEVRDQPQQQPSFDFNFAGGGGASFQDQAQPPSSFDFPPARSFAIPSYPPNSQLGLVSDDGSEDRGGAGGGGIAFQSWVASSYHPRTQPSSNTSASDFFALSYHPASTSTFLSLPTPFTPFNHGLSLSYFPTQPLGLVDDPLLPSSSSPTSQDHQPHDGDSDSFGESPDGDGSLGGEGEGTTRSRDKKVSREERRRASNRQSAKTFRDKKKNFLDQQRAELEAKDLEVAFLRGEVAGLTREMDSLRTRAEMERHWADGAW